MKRLLALGSFAAIAFAALHCAKTANQAPAAPTSSPPAEASGPVAPAPAPSPDPSGAVATAPAPSSGLSCPSPGASRAFDTLVIDASRIAESYCGSCHRGSSPEAKPAALKIFDLDQRGWYEGLSHDQLDNAMGRMKSKGTEDEQARFRAFIDAAMKRLERC